MKLLYRSVHEDAHFTIGVWSQFIKALNVASYGVPISTAASEDIWANWMLGKYAPPTKHWFGWCECFGCDFRDLIRIIASYRAPDSAKTSKRFRATEDRSRLLLLHAFAGHCKVQPDDLRTIIANSEFYHELTFQEPQ